MATLCCRLVTAGCRFGGGRLLFEDGIWVSVAGTGHCFQFISVFGNEELKGGI